MKRLFHVLKYDRAKAGTEFDCCSFSFSRDTSNSTTEINFVLIFVLVPELLKEHSPHSTVSDLLSMVKVKNPIPPTRRLTR